MRVTSNRSLIQAFFSSNPQFYALHDVLEATKLTEAEFVLKHPQTEIAKMNKDDFIKATLDQLDMRLSATVDRFVKSEDEEVNIIYRNDAIDQILNISSTVIR